MVMAFASEEEDPAEEDATSYLPPEEGEMLMIRRSCMPLKTHQMLAKESRYSTLGAR